MIKLIYMMNYDFNDGKVNWKEGRNKIGWKAKLDIRLIKLDIRLINWKEG